ncbi:hypothetical protein SAMN06265337_4234 [Hymenobacter gelipurpurascens]|uniref:Uncharacterized protein n=1 Tax=Hymenobacter gelipurpurascens TaxID=89968 RepID=A0A212UHC0_9BACT|nr:hypothetical protein [Hymenobacter gelipurpurascens]SNC77635.1 hypothetical protein SAMN06265337_4234 [Hymenobacter gelipurpurascens]
MPYKEDRPQIGLKFTATEYASLQAEADRAGVPVNTYARHLITERGQQPLGAEAASVRAHYQQREVVHQQLLDEYAQAAYQARALSQQVKFFRQQFLFLQWCVANNRPELLPEALQEALAQPELSVVLPGEENPALDTDSLENAPVLSATPVKKR